MENTVINAPAAARVARGSTRAQQQSAARWVIPVGGGMLAAALMVIGTPHVAWYLRLALATIAFAYIGGQSAAYLWSDQPDQG